MEPTNESRIPDGFTEYDKTVMSNWDNEIDEDVAEAIKDKPLYSQYAGLGFCGYVWYQNNKWCCEVWRFRTWCETFVSDTLEDIMADVSKIYGYE